MTTTRRFYHPLWTHLSAVALLVYGIAAALPGPGRMLVGLGLPAHAQPVATTVLFAALGVLFITISVFQDEVWARSEKGKRLNWASLFDDATVGMLAGMNAGAVPQVAGVALAAGVLLEIARPYRECPESRLPEDTAGLEAQLAEQARQGRSWVYWETQNPSWLSGLVALTSIGMLASACATAAEAPWVAALLAVVSVLMTLVFGGLCVSVTPGKLDVRLGVARIRLLSLMTSDIESEEVHSFRPLADFGGWGIRANREMKAYYFRGNRGVKVRTTNGKQYLVGSDTPDRLAAALRMAMGRS